MFSRWRSPHVHVLDADGPEGALVVGVELDASG